MSKSPLNLLGYDHAKVVLKNPETFEKVLDAFGFEKYTGTPPDFLENPRSVWGSHEAVFCLYDSSSPLGKTYFELHGDTVFDLSFLVDNAAQKGPLALEGAGKMRHTIVSERTFPIFPSRAGVLRFDHNTLNVGRGELDPLLRQYFEMFSLNKGQFFKIQGKQTALISQVTRSPNFGVQIPFNESLDDKSQIQEFVRDHKGPGVQHLALLTRDIQGLVKHLKAWKKASIDFLDITDTYYEVIARKVKIRENLEDLKALRIQVDQDPKDQSYLLQIFTQVLFGSFFFEIIQREGNIGFGEGNFQTLFEAMEIDQQRRGVL